MEVAITVLHADFTDVMVIWCRFWVVRD